MLRELPPSMMLPPAAVDATVAALLNLMSLPATEYGELCERSQKVAAMFQWPEIAAIWERAVMEQIEGRKLAGKVGVPVAIAPSSPVL